MKRNTLVIVIVAVAAFFLLFNPIQKLRDRNPTVSAPYVGKDAVTSLVSFAQASWKSPEDYVTGLFDRREVVFLGEFYKIRQQVQLVSALIPKLYAKGVRNLGIEYALSESQPDIDALLSAPSWDEAKARRITFTWVVTWGYQEYIDIYHAAWTLNHGLAAGAPRFRIIALNVRQDWTLVKTDADLQNSDTVHKVLANGIPDQHMAEVLKKEVLDKGEKALVFTSLQHAFTRYHSKDYEKNMKDKGFAEVRRFGNIIAERIGSRAVTVAFDSPWPDPSAKTGLAYPAEGAINAMVTALPAGRQSGGWDTAGTPLGDLPIRSSSYLSGYQSLTLAQFCDGYIALGPITSFQVTTPIPDFVPADAADYAVANYPGPKPSGLDAKMVQQSIDEEAPAIDKTLRQFR